MIDDFYDESIDLRDREQAVRWLNIIIENVLRLNAIAKEGCRSRRTRKLARGEMARRRREAKDQLVYKLHSAQRGLGVRLFVAR